MSIGGVVAMGGATPTKTPYGLGGNNKVGVSFSILIDKGPPFLSQPKPGNNKVLLSLIGLFLSIKFFSFKDIFLIDGFQFISFPRDNFTFIDGKEIHFLGRS